MEPLRDRMVKSVPMVALGMITFFLLFAKSEEAMEIVGRNCPQKAAYSWRSGIEPVDRVLCVLVHFFMQALSSVEGQWVAGYISSILLPALAFMAVEGSRLKAGRFLSLTPLHALLVQAIGVAVAFPLVWLPTYFLYHSGDRELNQVWQRKISLARVGGIAFASFVLLLNCIALLFPFAAAQKQTWVLLFQVAPIALALFWLPFPTSAQTPQQPGHRGVIALHLLQAGYGVAWHFTAILYAIRDPQLPARVFSLPTSWTNDNYGAYFLLIDATSLFLALVYLAAVEDGILIGLLVVLGSLLLGPGFAVSTYFVYREQTLSTAAAIISSHSQKKDSSHSQKNE